jgi:hypothetical protein
MRYSFYLDSYFIPIMLFGRGVDSRKIWTKCFGAALFVATLLSQQQITYVRRDCFQWRHARNNRPSDRGCCSRDGFPEYVTNPSDEQVKLYVAFEVLTAVVMSSGI